MHNNRLFKIVYYLIQKGRSTAAELAEMLEVSTRTVYRDLDALSGANIPIYTEAGRSGGIFLTNDFVIDKAIFSEEERQDIITAMKSFNFLGRKENSETLSKLRTVFDVKGEPWIEVDLSRWGNEKHDTEIFESIKSAVINRNAIIITYAGSNGRTDKRKIYPLMLSYKSKSWYLKAFCTERNDYRLFKLSRIISFDILDETFSGYSCPETNDSNDTDTETVRLLFPKEMSYRVYDEFNPSCVTENTDGKLAVTVKIHVDSWIVGYILSFGANVEIIEPAYLKKIISETAEKIYKKNKI